MACLVGQWTCATARHRRDVSVHAPSTRGASYQSPEQTRSQVQKPIIRSRTENAVTPSETPMPSVKYVFIVEPKVGGGSSYIWCCCCCGRSGGGGAAYFAGGGGGGAGGAGAGGRGACPLAAVRQAVRRAAVVRAAGVARSVRAAVVRAAAADGAEPRAARPCRSSVRPLRASIFVACFDRCARYVLFLIAKRYSAKRPQPCLLAYCPLHPQECGCLSGKHAAAYWKASEATSQCLRPPLATNRLNPAATLA